MSTRRRLPAVLGVGVVALCALASAIVLIAHAASPVRAAESDTDRVPEDLLWAWVDSCSHDDPSRMITSFGYDADGYVHVEVSRTGRDGAPITDEVGGVVADAPATRSLNACLNDRRVATADRLTVATAADRLEIYRWAMAWQVPCLQGNGFDAELPPFAYFVDPDAVPWYLLGGTDVASVPFERVLAARWRCDPIPPIVGPSGMVW